MIFGVRPLINPGTFVSEIDVEGSLEARQQVHEQFRTRDYVTALLARSSVDDELVQIRPYFVVEDCEGNTDTDDPAA